MPIHKNFKSKTVNMGFGLHSDHQFST